MNKFYEKLWEINCKLEELKDAFIDFSAIEKENQQKWEPKWTRALIDLEAAYSNLIELVRQKRGLMELPFPVIFDEDIKWLLGIPGAKEPIEVQRLRKQSITA